MRSIPGRAICLAVVYCLAAVSVPAQDRSPLATGTAVEPVELTTPAARVRFDGLPPALARRTAELAGRVRLDLHTQFGWKLPYRPRVVLLAQRNVFTAAADHPLSIAFAVPHRGLVVIDYSTVGRKPYDLQATLEHELCHLLLHAHIDPERLPRWLDEGLAQWVGHNPMSEIRRGGPPVDLNRAAISGTLIPFHRLRRGFPIEDRARILAYDQSRSFISYLAGRFGREGILRMLEGLRRGNDVGQAFQGALGNSPEELELAWHDSLRGPESWVLLISRLVYQLLFPAVALLGIIGLIQVRRRRRREIERMPDGEGQ
jgi:hypothetical protein